MESLLALEMVRVTEAAAIASARFMGRGDRTEADRAATESMRRTMDELEMHGTIVIGEGERDQAPMLYIGEQVGRRPEDDRRAAPQIDIAVDPLEGTNLVALGLANAITVLAASEKGGLVNAPDTYLEKLCVGPVAAGQVDITLTPQENVMGIGGAPEGVITAAALRCLGGEIQARFRYRNADERARGARMGHGDEDRVYRTEDLASGENLIFAATGVTEGDLLQGVRFFGGGARTHSLVMAYQSKQVRFVDTVHMFDRDRTPKVRLSRS